MTAGWEFYESELRALLVDVFTPAGVETVMTSRLVPPGSGLRPRTARQHFDAGDGQAVMDWAKSLTGMVAT